MEPGEKIDEIIFRLDAGNSVGYGHLSRCLSLAVEFTDECSLSFLIRSDDPARISDLISNVLGPGQIRDVSFLEDHMDVQDEVSFISDTVLKHKGFLVLDHYSITEIYQLSLKENRVKWLQFDSHARQKFYADIVLHGSPGATEAMYSHLVENPETRLLLGTSYAIVNRSFRHKRSMVKPRERIKKIFMCFGGGKDEGAALKCLEGMRTEDYYMYTIYILTSSRNPGLEDLKSFIAGYKHFQLIIDSTEVADFMAGCDLGIIAPGTLSYEAASLGLPMLLLTIADNQDINARGWVEKECARSLGTVECFTADKFDTVFKALSGNPSELHAMSVNCLEKLDGRGTERVKEQILSII